MADPRPSPSRALVLVRKPGSRQSFYSEEIADEIIDRISNGETLTWICKCERNGRVRERGEFPAFDTIMDWADPKDVRYKREFGLRFASARLRQQQYWMEEAIDIANSPEVGYEEVLEDSARLGVSLKRIRKDMISHRALKIETRMKVAARINPQLWAERLQAAALPEHDPSKAAPKLVIEGGLPDDPPPPRDTSSQEHDI